MPDDLDKFLNKVVSGTLIMMQSELGSKKGVTVPKRQAAF